MHKKQDRYGQMKKKKNYRETDRQKQADTARERIKE